MKKFFGSVFAAATLAFTAPASDAAPVDVDLMFVIDKSGSMGGEFTTLGANIANVLSGLSADTGIGSVQAGLVSYENVVNGVINLDQALTADATVLENAFNSVSLTGGTEDTAHAIAAVLPNGSLFSSAGWRNNTVKSVVTITDESGDNEQNYSYGGLTGYAAVGKKLDDVQYLNNIITLNRFFPTFEPASRPIGNQGDFDALFSLNDFRSNEQDFLDGFIARKITEITTGGGTPTGGSDGTPPSVVPLPAAGWMLMVGLGGLFAARRRKTA